MKEIDSEQAFVSWLPTESSVAVQDVDLREYSSQILDGRFPDCLFLGCELEPIAAGHIVQTGGVVIPDLPGFKFQIHRKALYRVSELFEGFELDDPNGYLATRDYAIYEQYLAHGKSPKDINTSLARRLHDHSITDALEEAIAGRKVVAVMGGHNMERRDPFYAKVARVSRDLTRAGYLLVSGGGPGAMEATHLGAYFATRELNELDQALATLSQRPPNAQPGKEYADPDWLHRAWRVLTEFPIPAGDETACKSIGIPTWLYGHEPPAAFATHIAKYFANSVREDGLLAIAHHGVIFAPGGAGTTQEIFQDAAQNHYKTQNDSYAPMVLFGVKHWTTVRPVWPLLKQVSASADYGKLVSLTDDEDEVVRQITRTATT